jgi:hypothetical protein
LGVSCEILAARSGEVGAWTDKQKGGAADLSAKHSVMQRESLPTVQSGPWPRGRSLQHNTLWKPALAGFSFSDDDDFYSGNTATALISTM